MREIRSVRLCNNPDKVCLQGGCGYCSDGSPSGNRWWSMGTLAAYAREHDMMGDYLYGREHGWPNRQKRYRDG